MLRWNSHSRELLAVAALCAALTSAFAEQSAAQSLSQHSFAAVPSSRMVPSANDHLDAVFASQPCVVTKALDQFDAPIPHVSKRVQSHEPVTIVALGSSSTAGAGASSPSFSYPSRLWRELQHRFPREAFNIINLGKNGTEAADMIARFDDVVALKPDLVIWQVGTNAVLRDKSVPDVSNSLESGIRRIRESGADVLLIDPQYAPAVNAKSSLGSMVEMMGWVAKRANVPLFRRYVAMRHWHTDLSIPFEQFTKPDGIHMNDWGYSCFARLLADNISTAVIRSRAVADVKPPIQ